MPCTTMCLPYSCFNTLLCWHADDAADVTWLQGWSSIAVPPCQESMECRRSQLPDALNNTPVVSEQPDMLHGDHLQPQQAFSGQMIVCWPALGIWRCCNHHTLSSWCAAHVQLPLIDLVAAASPALCALLHMHAGALTLQAHRSWCWPPLRKCTRKHHVPCVLHGHQSRAGEWCWRIEHVVPGIHWCSAG
jgi:hypothetical protein